MVKKILLCVISNLMQKNKYFSLLLFIATSLSFVLCCNNAIGQTDSFFIKTNSGIYYHIYHPEPAEHPKVGDFVWMHLLKKNNEGKEIFNTQLFEAPQGIEMQLKGPKFDGDIEEVFLYMKKGDTAFVKIPYSLAQEGDTSSTKFFYYEIYVYNWKEKEYYLDEKETQKQDQLKIEKKAISDYLEKKDLKKSKTETSGLVVYGNFGKRKKIKDGDTVTINYIGRFLNDSVFESSWETGMPIVLVAGHKDVIIGWEMALKYLGKNASVQTIIPSYLAYGEKGTGNEIPPNTVLLFDLQIMKISPKKKIAH